MDEEEKKPAFRRRFYFESLSRAWIRPARACCIAALRLAASTRVRAALALLSLGGVCFEEGKMAAADPAEPPGGSVRSFSDVTPLLSGSRPGTPPPIGDAAIRAELPACPPRLTRRPPGRRRTDPDRAGRRDGDSCRGESERVSGPNQTAALRSGTEQTERRLRDKFSGSFRQTRPKFSLKNQRAAAQVQSRPIPVMDPRRWLVLVRLEVYPAPPAAPGLTREHAQTCLKEIRIQVLSLWTEFSCLHLLC